MGKVKQQMMEEQEEFWNDCQDIMSGAETITEFFGMFEAAEKAGEVQRPEHISHKQFTEEAKEAYSLFWEKYQPPLT